MSSFTEIDYIDSYGHPPLIFSQKNKSMCVLQIIKIINYRRRIKQKIKHSFQHNPLRYLGPNLRF